MNITEWESFLGFDDILNLPNRVMQIITGDKSKRDEIYREAIKLHGSDLSYDWFLDIYMEELAKRKDNKQYFTPREVPDICAILTGTDGIVHEPTAGTRRLAYSLLVE